MKKAPGGGLSYDIRDNSLLEDDDWVAALDQLDRRGDKKPLTDLLRSSRELPPRAREYLADMIERGVPSPATRPRTPAYRMSEIDFQLMLANKAVRSYVTSGMPVKEALRKVAHDLQLNEGELATAYAGKRGSLNRSKHRL